MQRPLIVDVASALLLTFVWSFAASTIFLLPPVGGAALVLLFGAIFAARYLRPGSDPLQIERCARSRARPLGAQWPWAIGSAVAASVFLLGLVSILSHLAPPAPELDPTIADFLKKPLAMLPLLLADAVVDPLVQEVAFRGWIQGRLSREFGPEVAIVSAAGLFSAVFGVVHLGAWNIPPLFLLGLASGYTVYLTRSVWSGVMMNAAFSLGVDLIDPPTVDGSRLEGFSAGPDGLCNVILVMLAAAIAAILVWHRQRIVRDRIAAAAPPAGEGPGAD